MKWHLTGGKRRDMIVRHIPRTHTHTRTLMYARTHAHTHMHTYAHTHTHTHTHTCTHTHAHTHTHTHAHTHACTHTQAWVGHPYCDIIDNTTDFENKICRVIEVVCRRLGKRLGVDIDDRLQAQSKKRKYLVTTVPDIKAR